MTSWRDAWIKISTKNSSNHASPQAKEANYLPRYNALSTLEVHTIGKVQHIWTLCVLYLKLAEQLFAICLLLELEDDDDFMMIMMLL
jgi:hypothetical protein